MADNQNSNDPNTPSQPTLTQSQATQQQVDIANSLNNVLLEIESKFGSINSQTQSQAESMMQLSTNIAQMQSIASNTLSNSTKVVDKIIDASNSVINTFSNSFYQKMNESVEKVSNTASNSITQSANSLSALSDASDNVAKNSSTYLSQTNDLLQSQLKQNSAITSMTDSIEDMQSAISSSLLEMTKAVAIINSTVEHTVESFDNSFYQQMSASVADVTDAASNSIAQTSTSLNSLSDMLQKLSQNASQVSSDVASQIASIEQHQSQQSSDTSALVNNIEDMQSAISSSLLELTKAVAIINSAVEHVVESFGSTTYQQMSASVADVADAASNSISRTSTSLSSLSDMLQTLSQNASVISSDIANQTTSVEQHQTQQSSDTSALVNSIESMQSVISSSMLDLTNAITIIMSTVAGVIDNFGNSFYQQMNVAVTDVSAAAVNGITQSTQSLSALGEASREVSEDSSTFSETVANQANELAKSHHRQSDTLNEYNESSQETLELTEEFSSDMKELSVRVKSLTSGFFSGIKSILSGGLGILKMAFSGFSTLMGAGMKFVKFSLSIPFTIAQKAAELGNKLRSDVVTVIQQAGEDLKEKFDMTSNIGEGIMSLTERGKSMLLAFQSPTHKLVKLFGMGAAGIAKMISEFGQHLESMGHFSELFGRSLGNNQTKLENFLVLVKGLGLSSEDLAYFAQDAGINLKHINTSLNEFGVTLKSVSKEYGIDRKRLSKNFMILRRDITDFGHLSNEEILKTTASLTHMRIKLEDAVAVFKKFSTFEDAANSVAILSQTFGMNLDAFDMIQAKNPKEIIDMFRNSMRDTGRSFQDLNRFEKDLMAQHTGMSAESLKALMHYREIGYTHEQAVKKMESEKPHAKQMKALKGLNSAIKEIQKIMQYTSPFEAFAEGLAANATLSGDLKNAMISLSKGYEGIYEYARKLEPDKWEGLIRPIRMIIDIMKNIFQSEAFKDGLTQGLEAVAGFVAKMFGVSNPDRMLSEIATGINLASKPGGALDAKTNKDFRDQFTNALKNIPEDLVGVFENITGYAVKDVFNLKDPASVLKYLKEAQKAADKHPGLKQKYQELMNHVADKVGGVNYKDAKTDKQVTVINSFSDKLRADLLAISDLNSNNASKLFDLSGRVMKAIIQGAAVAFLSVMKIVNDTIEGAAGVTDALSPGENLFEKFLKFNPGELRGLAGKVGDAMQRFLNNSEGLMSIGRWLFDGFKSMFSAVIDVFLYTFALGVDAIFGSQYAQSPKKALKATQIAASRPSTTETIASLDEYDQSKTHDLRLHDVAALFHDMNDRINKIDGSQATSGGAKEHLQAYSGLLENQLRKPDVTSRDITEIAKNVLSVISSITTQKDVKGAETTYYSGDSRIMSKNPFEHTNQSWYMNDAQVKENKNISRWVEKILFKKKEDKTPALSDMFKKSFDLLGKSLIRGFDLSLVPRINKLNNLYALYSKPPFDTAGGWKFLDNQLKDRYKGESPVVNGELTTIQAKDAVSESNPFDADSIDKLPISQNILDSVIFGYTKTYSVSPLLEKTNVALYNPDAAYGAVSSNMPAKNPERFTSADAKRFKEELTKEKKEAAEPLVCDIVTALDSSAIEMLMKAFASNNFVKYLTRADLIEGGMGLDISALMSRCMNPGSNSLAPEIELK
jgi:hypothetical protein